MKAKIPAAVEPLSSNSKLCFAPSQRYSKDTRVMIAHRNHNANTSGSRRGLTTLIQAVVGTICLLTAGPVLVAEQGAPSNLPTLFIAADSTAASNAEFTGWGDAIKPYFAAKKITVVNRGMGGTSSHSLVLRGDWDALIREKLKPGDFVFIQFSVAEKNPIDATRVPGSLPGVGLESTAVTLATGKTDRVQTYGSYIRKFISETRQKGATPILITSTPPNAWHAGNFNAMETPPNAWLEQVSRQESVLLIDLFTALADEYQRQGSEQVRVYFPRDHIHTSAKGADVTASIIVALLADNPKSGLTDYFSERGRSVVPCSKRPQVKVRSPHHSPEMSSN